MRPSPLEPRRVFRLAAAAPLLAPVGRCKELLLHFGLLGDKKE